MRWLLIVFNQISLQISFFPAFGVWRSRSKGTAGCHSRDQDGREVIGSIGTAALISELSLRFEYEELVEQQKFPQIVR